MVAARDKTLSNSREYLLIEVATGDHKPPDSGQAAVRGLPHGEQPDGVSRPSDFR
jgi:hypothetical protein